MRTPRTRSYVSPDLMHNDRLRRDGRLCTAAVQQNETVACILPRSPCTRRCLFPLTYRRRLQLLNAKTPGIRQPSESDVLQEIARRVEQTMTRPRTPQHSRRLRFSLTVAAWRRRPVVGSPQT